MKTPRDLILERHASVQNRLDQVRNTALATALQPKLNDTARRQQEFTPHRVMAWFWAEIFWHSKRVWLGLGTAWVVIILLQLNTAHEAQLQVNRLPLKRTKITMVLHHHPLWATALGETDEPAGNGVSVPEPASKPHSENKVTHPSIFSV
jgi:hypothetical protein